MSTRGDEYTIDDISLIGDLRDVAPEALEALYLIEEGQTFSQRRITATEERMTATLGNAGYTFATASGIPPNRRRRHGKRSVFRRLRQPRLRTAGEFHRQQSHAGRSYAA